MKFRNIVILGVLLLFSFNLAFAKVFNTTLYGVVNPFSVIPAIMVLHMAEKGDVVIIDIDSPGGYVVSGVELLKAMKSTKATVQTQTKGLAASMAAVILFSGDKVKIWPSARIMIHTGSVCDGDYCVITKPTNHFFVYSYVVRMLKTCCFRVLTADEKYRVLKGEDVWISGKELIRRFS